MRSLRNLHQLCVAEKLGDFQSVIFDFKTNFDFLYEEFNLPMTLKIHVIIDQYSDYFSELETQWSIRMLSLLKRHIQHLKCPKEFINLKFQGKLGLLSIKSWPWNRWSGTILRELVLCHQQNLDWGLVLQDLHHFLHQI